MERTWKTTRLEVHKYQTGLLLATSTVPARDKVLILIRLVLLKWGVK